MKKILFFLVSFLLFISCQNKQKVFLGFQLLDSRENYYKHGNEIEDVDFENSLISTYNYNCGSEASDRVKFQLLPSFYNDNLVELRLSGNVSSFFKPQSFFIDNILNDYKSQYGNPTSVSKSDYVYFKSLNTFDGRLLSYSSKGIVYEWVKNDYKIIIQHEIITENSKEKDILDSKSINIIYEINQDVIIKENEVRRENTKNAL
jgi:hypothetical protein